MDKSPKYYVALSGNYFMYNGVKYSVERSKKLPFFPNDLYAVLEKECDDQGYGFYASMQYILQKQYMAFGYSEYAAGQKASDVTQKEINQNSKVAVDMRDNM